MKKGINLLSELERSRTEFFSEISWGTHLCYFYEKKEDLLEMLIPYFREGLEENNYCVWITPEELNRSEVINSLKNSIPNFKSYLHNNQIKIVSYQDWYVNDKTLNLDLVLENWINHLNQALDGGYNGLRVTGDGRWLGEDDLKKFIDYETQVNSIIGNYQIIAVCTYPIDKFNKFQILDIASSHQYVLAKTSKSYRIIENNDRKKKEHQEKILQINLEKIQKMEIIGILSSGIAHDLGKFLTIIQGYTDLSLMEVEKNNPLFEYLNYIQKSANDASELIKQIYSFSLIKNNNEEIIDINEIILPKIEILKILIKENIEIKTNLNPKLWNILADSGKIEQILMNLLMNSRDAMPEGGTIIIRTENHENKEQFQINNFKVTPGKYVKYTTEDNGKGMEKNIIEKIFEPFFTTKKPGEGTGLGLPMVYHIVKKYMGWIDVWSEPNKGTKFTVYLPAHFSN